MGFCCPYSYYKTTLSLSGKALGLELGVNRRTADRWRERCKALASTPCSPTCFSTLRKPPA